MIKKIFILLIIAIAIFLLFNEDDDIGYDLKSGEGYKIAPIGDPIPEKPTPSIRPTPTSIPIKEYPDKIGSWMPYVDNPLNLSET